jgi:hypothetical protein
MATTIITALLLGIGIAYLVVRHRQNLAQQEWEYENN